MGPLFDFFYGANVAGGDDLILINEKNADFGGSNDLLDLVFSLVSEHPGFFIQPVGLVGNQAIEGIFAAVHIAARPFEQILDIFQRILLLPQFLEIYVPGGGVLGHILGIPLSVGDQLYQQPDGHHAFSCAWAAFNNNRVFLMILQRAFDRIQDSFIGHLLFVQKNKFLTPCKHISQYILQGLGRTDYPLIH